MAVKIRDGSNGYTDEVIGKFNPGVKIGETYMDWGQGSLRETGNTYDLAIDRAMDFLRCVSPIRTGVKHEIDVYPMRHL